MSAEDAVTGQVPSKQKYRWAVAAPATLVGAYAVVCILLYCFQASLAFPGSYRQGSRNVQVQVPPGAELLHLTSADGVGLTGLFGKAKGESHAAPSVLYFYGNGDALPTALYHFEMFRRLGANCVIIDYEGYGLSGGSPSENGCYAAAEAAYRYLLGRADVDHRKLVPAGFSLGGAVAIDLAYRHRGEGTIRGLITFSTFTSMREEAERGYPWVPVGALLKFRFASEEKAASLALPWLISHGAQDVNIPPACANRLAAAAAKAGATVTRVLVPDGTHMHFFDRGERQLSEAIGAFLRQF